MATLAYENLELAGAPVHGEAAREFGRDIQRNLGIEPMAEPFNEGLEELVEPETCERRVRRNLPDWQERFVSDDYVEYTWHAPTARVYVGRPRMRPPEPSYSYPDWAYNALGGVPAVTRPGMLTASETIVGPDFVPLTDLPWPEYVETERGGSGRYRPRTRRPDSANRSPTPSADRLRAVRPVSATFVGRSRSPSPPFRSLSLVGTIAAVTRTSSRFSHLKASSRYSTTASDDTTLPYFASMSKRLARCGPSARSPTASSGTIVR